MHFAVAEVEKLSQMYRKLAELRLWSTSCSFAVADLIVNLRCPALLTSLLPTGRITSVYQLSTHLLALVLGSKFVVTLQVYTVPGMEVLRQVSVSRPKF